MMNAVYVDDTEARMSRIGYEAAATSMAQLNPQSQFTECSIIEELAVPFLDEV